MSAIRAHTSPSTLPSFGPYSASLSPSNLPGACGWLLPFRQCPLISPGWREVSFMSYVYSRAAEPPPPSFAGTVGWNMQERNHCRKASIEIPVLSPADSTSLWKKKELKGWNPHKWSLNVVLQEEIVLILLELNGHGSRRQKRARKATKRFREVLLNNVSGWRHNRFSKFCFLK